MLASTTMPAPLPFSVIQNPNYDKITMCMEYDSPVAARQVGLNQNRNTNLAASISIWHQGVSKFTTLLLQHGALPPLPNGHRGPRGAALCRMELPEPHRSMLLCRAIGHGCFTGTDRLQTLQQIAHNIVPTSLAWGPNASRCPQCSSLGASLL